MASDNGTPPTACVVERERRKGLFPLETKKAAFGEMAGATLIGIVTVINCPGNLVDWAVVFNKHLFAWVSAQGRAVSPQIRGRGCEGPCFHG